jgi:hypothetical protein
MPGKSPPSAILLAPAASEHGAALKLPGASSFPPLDQHLVEPETHQEMVRGERLLAQPAQPPHGDRHCELDYVIRAHVRPGFVGSTDMLTRLSEGSDFAADTSVRKQGKDPTTGQRYLEELAFEVVYKQPLKKITERAEDLSERGVRRVFAIFVKTGQVKEWAHAARAWRALDPASTIRDRCLSRPLAVRALLDAAAADDEVARALEAKNNPAIASMKAASEQRSEQRGEQRGEKQATAAAILAVLAVRGLAVPDGVRAAIDASNDLERLRRWHLRAITATSADGVIDER